MTKRRKKKRRLNPIRLLSVLALEFVIIAVLLILCIKVFPDNPILSPILNGRQEKADVILDPGHGGYDVGSTYGNLYEKDVTLKLTKDVGKRLEANGVHVRYTRESDQVSWPANETEDLCERVKISNASKAKLFVSIHTNATEVENGSYGYEIWGKMKQKKIAKLSKQILKELDSLGYSQNRGLCDQDLSPLYVLQNNEKPAILIEAGFLASEHDRSYLLDDGKRKAFANKIADGITKYLNEEKERNP